MQKCRAKILHDGSSRACSVLPFKASFIFSGVWKTPAHQTRNLGRSTAGADAAEVPVRTESHKTPA